MTDRDRQIVAEFRERLLGETLTHVRRIIIYGSRLRDDAPEDSDLDIMVLVDEMVPGLEERLDEAAYSVMWEHDFRPVLSLKVFTEDRYRSALARGYSFYRNVEREGIAA